MEIILLYKRVRYLCKYIVKCLYGFFMLIFFKRDENLILLANCPLLPNSKKQELFVHNTKALLLYLFNKNISMPKYIYICDDINISSKMKEIGITNIYKRKSIKGIYYSLKAKYWLTDYNTGAINNSWLRYGAKVINLWHGIPLKKILFDEEKNHIKLNNLIYKIWDYTREKENLFIVNCKYEQSCYETAFLTNKNNIKILGSPRLDILFHDIPHSDLFMEEDFANIKRFKEQGKKLFFYTPTFRDTGKDISGWLKSEKLKQFLKDNNAILVCKLHPADKNSLNFDLPEEFYKMNSDSDIYPVLKYSDALITDYSSIYFDYLLLDKPILYYPIDLDEYQEKCRGFYRPYEELTAGIKAYNENELISAMQDVINGVDNYKEQRKNLRDKMFKYQDGKNCERVVEWIRSLG